MWIFYCRFFFLFVLHTSYPLSLSFPSPFRKIPLNRGNITFFHLLTPPLQFLFIPQKNRSLYWINICLTISPFFCQTYTTNTYIASSRKKIYKSQVVLHKMVFLMAMFVTYRDGLNIVICLFFSLSHFWAFLLDDFGYINE